MAIQTTPLLTIERYLELERAAENKSEYWRGEILAMSGGTGPHSLIAVNTMAQLHGQLRGKRCLVYNSDMKVYSPLGHVSYPDGVVACDQPHYRDDSCDVLMNPVLIVEVLSPSTEAYDRGRKFERYRAIESLRQYLLIAQDRVQVYLYSRTPQDQWLLTSFSSFTDSVPLESIGCRLSVAECYERIELPESATRL